MLHWWPLAVKGAAGVCFQVVFLREIISVFFGNEFSIALVLAAWLLGGGFGSLCLAALSGLTGGPRSVVAKSRSCRGAERPDATERVPPNQYFRYTLAQSIIAVAALFLLRGGLFPGIAPGQSPSLPAFVLTAGLVCAAVGFCEGARFVLLASFCRDEKSGGRIYAAEAFGALFGGLLLAVAFLLRAQPFVLFFAAGAVNLLTCLPAANSRLSFPHVLSGNPLLDGSPLNIRGDDTKRRFLLTIRRNDNSIRLEIWVTLVLWVLLGILFAPALERISLARQWRPFQVLSSRYSVYGNSVLLSHGSELVFVRDGVPETTNQPDALSVKNRVFFSFAFYSPQAEVRSCRADFAGEQGVRGGGDEAYTEAYVEEADDAANAAIRMKATRYPKKVLIIGDPALAVEVARYPVEQVYYTDTDPAAIKTLEKYFFPAGNRKIRCAPLDPVRFLAAGREKFDVIIISGDAPAGLKDNRIFTTEFADLAGRRLAPGGVIAVSLPGSAEYLGSQLRRVHASVYRSFAACFAFGKVVPAEPVIYLFSATRFSRINAAITPDRAFFNESYIAHVLEPFRERLLELELAPAGASENTYARPIALYHGLAYWLAKFGARAGETFSFYVEVLSRLRSAGWVLAVLAAALCALPAGSASALYGLGLVNGFVALSCETLLLFMFQVHYGYLYFALCLLIAVFMAGLGFGGAAAAQRGPRRSYLVPTEFFHSGFYLFLFVFLNFAIRIPQSALFLFLSLAAGGFLVGWEFGLLTHLAGRDASLSRAVGKIYGLDLLGGVLGCVAVPFLLIPVFGVYDCFLVLAAAKLGNLISVKRAGF